MRPTRPRSKRRDRQKKDYVAACRAGTAAAPAATPAAAPAARRRLRPPSSRGACPRATSKPAAVAPKVNVGATGAGGFTATRKRAPNAPSDTVVWVNTKSGVYHFAGDAQLRHDETGDVHVRSGREGGGGPRG